MDELGALPMPGPRRAGHHGPAACSIDGDAMDCHGFVDGAAKCGLKSMYDVISRFDDTKRDLAKAIGFGGLLFFPQHSQLNKNFSMWLLSKVDQTSQSIVIDSTIIFPFNKNDVELVFGIPAAGRRVVGAQAENVNDVIQYVRDCLGVQGEGMPDASGMHRRYWTDSMAPQC